MTRRIVLSVVLFCITTAAAAQTGPKSRFTSYENIIATYRSLGYQLEQIGETYEHRPLYLAVITAKKNADRLDTIRRNITLLANGDGNVDQIVKETPVIVWLAFGVHGNESSSAEA